MYKRHIANFLRRAPWTGYLAQRAYRLFQPRVTVGAVGAVFDDQGRLLVVEHVFHPKFPWGLPGGWLSRNEAPGDGVCREVYEETALRVEIVKPLVIMPTPMIPHHLDVAFLCRLLPGSTPEDVRLSDELLDHAWINPLNLPPFGLFHTRVVRTAVTERALEAAAAKIVS